VLKFEMSFQVHLKLLEKESFLLKIDQSLKFCTCLLFTLFTAVSSTKYNLKKYLKEILKKLVQEGSWYAKKFLIFSILGFIHACTVNVNFELFEDGYFISWIVLRNSLNLHIKILHKPRFIYICMCNGNALSMIKKCFWSFWWYYLTYNETKHFYFQNVPSCKWQCEGLLI